LDGNRRLSGQGGPLVIAWFRLVVILPKIIPPLLDSVKERGTPLGVVLGENNSIIERSLIGNGRCGRTKEERDTNCDGDER